MYYNSSQKKVLDFFPKYPVELLFWIPSVVNVFVQQSSQHLSLSSEQLQKVRNKFITDSTKHVLNIYCVRHRIWSWKWYSHLWLSRSIQSGISLWGFMSNPASSTPQPNPTCFKKNCCKQSSLKDQSPVSGAPVCRPFSLFSIFLCTVCHLVWSSQAGLILPNYFLVYFLSLFFIHEAFSTAFLISGLCFGSASVSLSDRHIAP